MSRIYRTKKEKKVLLCGFESSNLSLEDYCKEQDISPSTFRKWLKKSQIPKTLFHEYEVKESVREIYFCEISLGKKIKIKLRSLNEIEKVKSLIEYLVSY